MAPFCIGGRTLEKSLRANLERVQNRLAVWLVLVICLWIVKEIIGWGFLQYVIWLAAASVVFLIGLWLSLAWQLWRHGK